MSNIKWEIRFTQTAEKEFEKLDKAVCRTINRYIYERIAIQEDPKRFGKPLSGNLKEFWRYRIGDYRLICEVREQGMIIFVARIAHRKEVYD